MYEKFDAFLAIDTWYTRHPSDEQRFFKALRQVVNDPNFNPDKLKEYMAAKLQIKAGNEHFNFALDHYRTAAWAVKDYLATS